MNALCYKIVFSKRLGTLVAVGEHTAGQGKAAGTGVRTVVFPSSSAASADNFVGLLKSVFATVALSFVTVGYATAAGPAVNTLPTGYSVNSGNVAISSTSSATNAAMTIQQTSDKASVNWNSFSIGSGAAVNVQQNNANSVLLNRVVGNDPSQIFGKLTANGQVILINPNGVVFGKGGSVTASAFTASTFGMTDADFLAGKHKFSHNGRNNGVTVESGATIDTTGYVALIGASVDNQGAITTQGGAVVLAAGDSVALPSALTDNIGVPLRGKVRLELLPSTLNAMVANSGTITTDGGQVLMQAAALSDAVASITHTGTIDTTGAQGGAVTLQAEHGIIKATGNIKANSKNAKNKGGDIIIGRDEITGMLAKATNVSGARLESQGGFVETSGEYLKTESIQVKAKDWLLDPNDIEIGSTTTTTGGSLTAAQVANGVSKILAADVNTALNGGTNVIIATSASANGGNGDITVNAAVSNTAAGNTLTLNAGRNVVLNNSITASNISLNAATGSVSGAGALTTTGMLTLNSATDGTLSGNISGAGGLTKTGAGIITLQGAKNYTGATTVSSGTLSLTTATATPAEASLYSSSSFDIASGATLDFNIPNNAISNGNKTIFKGAGKITKTGGGNLRWGNGGSSNPTQFLLAVGSLFDVKAGSVTASSGYSGNWSSNKSSLNIASGASFTTAEANVQVDALTGDGALGLGWTTLGGITTGVNNTAAGTYNITAGTATFGGVISANSGVTTGGTFTKIGTGTQILTKDNTYTTTTINGGTLQIGEGGSTGTLGTGTVAVNANANLTFNRSNDMTIANAISGTGTMNLISTGTTTTLTANSSFSGITNVSNSSLQIGTGGPTGTLGTSTVILNTANLSYKRTGDTAINNAISGTGNVTAQTTGGGLSVNKTINLTGNISFDNTGGTIDTNGAITPPITNATGTAARGIYIDAAVTATGGNIAMSGVSDSNYGIQTTNNGKLSATTTSSGTKGNITLTGTSAKLVGFNNLGTIGAAGALNITGTKTTSTGYQGVNIANNLNGKSIEITGFGKNWDAVQFNDNVTVTASNTLTVTGDSDNGKGLYFLGTNTFNADNYQMKGTNRSSGNTGVHFAGNSTFNSTSTTTASLIEATKTVAGGDTIYNAGTLTINSGSGKATLQTAKTIDGQHNSAGGIRMNGGSTVNTSGDVTIGSSNSSNSYTFNQGTINAEGNLTLKGQTNSTSGTMAGVWLQDSGGTGAKITGTKGANITIDGTNLSGGTAVNLGVNSSANSITTTGTTSAGAVGDIFIKGESASGHGIANAATEVRNTSTSATAKGNVTLIGTTLAGSGQGIYNVAAGQKSSSNAIYAAGNLTLTGNSVNGHAVNTTGTLEAGGLLTIEGTAIPSIPVFNATSIGIYVGNTVQGGTVEMTGITGASKGIDINGAVTSKVGGIKLTGTGGGNYYYGQGVVIEGPTTSPVWAGGSLNSAAGITIDGTATGGSGPLNVYGAQIQGAVTARTDISISGKNISITDKAGLSIENTIQSTAGNITVKAENTSGTKTALLLNTNGKLLTDAANSTITIKTNGMDLNTGAVVQAGTAGTGTVNIKTTGNNDISIGGGDVGNNSAADQTLGINNAELNQIKAGNLVIGDTTKTGKITVATTTTTAEATGHITLQTGGDIAFTGGLNVGGTTPTKKLTLNAGGVVTQNANAAIKATELQLLGANAEYTLNSKTNSVGKISGSAKKIEYTNAGALYIDTVEGIQISEDIKTDVISQGIQTTGGTNITTQTGNLYINEAITNTGDVIVGAGVAGLAGELSTASTGDVKTVDGKGITHTGGNLYVYSGSAANTGLLSNLDGALGNLQVTGTATQNVDTNRAFNAAAPITGSTETAQVMFREKVTITNGLVGTTVEKTYGDANTKNTVADKAGLLAEAITKLKGEVGNSGSASVYDTATSGNIIKIKKSLIIDSLTGNLDSAAYSQSGNGYLKANGDYAYNRGANTLTSTKYNIDNTTFTDSVKVTVAQKALTGSITPGSSIYGDSLNLAIAGATTLTGGALTSTDGKYVTGDTVTAGASTVVLNSTNTSTSGNLIAGTHTQTLKDLGGGDAANYSYTGVTGNYTVDQRPLTVIYAANNKVFDGNSDAVVAATFKDLIARDIVTVKHTSATFGSADVGAGKTVTVAGLSLDSKDAANYKLHPDVHAGNKATTTANITAVPPTPPNPVVPVTNTGARVKVPVGSANPFALASAEDLADDTCSANSIENCQCEESAVSQGVSICYEPKAGAKGAAR